MKHNLLVIDDCSRTRATMKNLLEAEGYFVKSLETGSEALAHIKQKTIKFSIGFVDSHLGLGEKGHEVIKAIKEIDSELRLIGFSADDSDETSISSIDSGAIMYLRKDTSTQRLLSIIQRMCEEVEEKSRPMLVGEPQENQIAVESVGLKGCSDNLAQIARLIFKFGPSDETLLIRGENGTGKEIVAKAVHDFSNRSKGPYITLNCAAIPKDLIESELFGHEKGSFTGATGSKIGKFQAAEGGTLFLDEIGDMPLAAQATMLRVLQNKTITAVGSNQEKKINVRIVTATNQPLEKMIEQGTFRKDLFYRINTLPIDLAPLRERLVDIPLLAEYFLCKLNEANGTKKILLQSVIKEFQKMPWHGNVRELEHTIKRMYTMSEANTLNLDLLKVSMKAEKSGPALDYESLKERHRLEEVEFLQKILDSSESLTQAAERLGLSRSTLRSKIAAFKILTQLIKDGVKNE